VETEELIRSEIYHSFISEMSMYMYQKVDIYPKVHVSNSTCIQKYIYIQNYPNVHVSKTIQATCTCMQMYIYSIRHVSEVKLPLVLSRLWSTGLISRISSLCGRWSRWLNINDGRTGGARSYFFCWWLQSPNVEVVRHAWVNNKIQ
jgi:hypothetical protein